MIGHGSLFLSTVFAYSDYSDMARMKTFKFFSATVVADFFFGFLVAGLGAGFRRLVTAFAHLYRRMDANKGSDKGIFAGFEPHAVS